MRVGPLHRRITIQRSTIVREGSSRVTKWDDLFTTWAGVTQQSGREYFASAAVQSSRQMVFRIRYRVGVTVVDRVRYNGLIYNISDVREVGRREGIELHAVGAAV